MEHQQRTDDGSSSRKAIESVPDKALLLPDGSPEKPRGEDNNKDLPPADPDEKKDKTTSGNAGSAGN